MNGKLRRACPATSSYFEISPAGCHSAPSAKKPQAYNILRVRIKRRSRLRRVSRRSSSPRFDLSRPDPERRAHEESEEYAQPDHGGNHLEEPPRSRFDGMSGKGFAHKAHNGESDVSRHRARDAPRDDLPVARNLNRTAHHRTDEEEGDRPGQPEQAQEQGDAGYERHQRAQAELQPPERRKDRWGIRGSIRNRHDRSSLRISLESRPAGRAYHPMN
ncbi:hypothetical protein BSF38_03806 [Paludisphaera borealis]|uniref:Uncharacterized protein n=1 Tax=Paludisphaera borealis TaxID=1387353 RepID=A0A1U7CTN0_9BACT|nr:hypothetical protein BSF38_03806 [Paludisphaera borealis]